MGDTASMSWKTCNPMSQRTEFIALAILPKACVSKLCRDFDISRKTGCKWLARYRQGGAAALCDQSRRPKSSPGATSGAPVAAILALRHEHPTWGPRKLRRRLQTLGQSELPARSTIGAILSREGAIDPQASQNATAFTRFERGAPNELWQMDFKGHFALGDATRCHPLTVLDDHSRYLIGLAACACERTEVVQAQLEKLFRHYGLPERILCDNGSPWSGPGGDYTALAVWLMLLGVGMCHGRPFHPQTQGKDERFHRTLKADLLARRDLACLKTAQPVFDAYRHLYNHDRPHQALGDQVPATRYQTSSRSWRGLDTDFAYSEATTVRTVKAKGEITFANRFFYIGQAFDQYPVALHPRARDGLYHVYFHAYPIGQIDLSIPNSHPKGRCYPMAKITPIL
jgi:transposase InsO family protein